MSFTCDNCGPIPYILFDGYDFAERLLEGVKFKASFDDGELVVDTVADWDTDPYLSGLNKNRWMASAKCHVEGLDVANCPQCGEEISVGEDQQPARPVHIGRSISGAELMEIIQERIRSNEGA